MKINMSIEEILQRTELLDNLIKKDLSMPGRLSWIISDNFDELKKVTDKFRQKQALIGQKFIDAGKTTTTKDGNVEIMPDFFSEYASSIQELLEIMREVDIQLIPIEEFRKLDILSVLDVKALSFMTDK